MIFLLPKPKIINCHAALPIRVIGGGGIGCNLSFYFVENMKSGETISIYPESANI